MVACNLVCNIINSMNDEYLYVLKATYEKHFSGFPSLTALVL